MSFNSALFIACFGVFYLIYFFAARNATARQWLLLLASLGFYAALSHWGLLVLFFIALSDFTIAKSIQKAKKEGVKKFLFCTALFIDAGCLLTFRHITDWFHLGDLAFWPAVIGISFFVFRSLGYVIDVFRETIEPAENDFFSYLLYLAYFPLILVGPISPARDFLPQVKQPFVPASVNTGKAVFWLISGIIKKYILANYLAVNFVERVFGNSHLFTGIENIMATVAQALVVYLDFGGYTDLVCGISLLLGIDIVENFNFPYISQNITEYWRRWHMSLSRWLNEYLFFPLSFIMRSLGKTGIVMAVFITFVISGFWHGTSFHYTFWGMLHGVALSWDVVSAKARDRVKQKVHSYIYSTISVLFTFSFLALSGIFFKAPDMQSGFAMLQHIFNSPDLSYMGDWVLHYPWVMAIIVGVLLLQFPLNMIYGNIVSFFEKLSPFLLSLLLVLVIFMAYQVSGMESLPFIYLKF